MQGQDSGCIKTFQPSPLKFCRVIKDVVWCYHDGRQHIFYWSILAVFSESIAQLVIDNRDQNQLFYLVVAAHSLPISLDTQYHLLWHQSGLYDRLWCLISFRPRFFSNIIVMLSFSLFNLIRHGSILFHFSSGNSQLEIWSIKCLVLNNVESKHRAFLYIQPYANAQKRFYDQC